MPQLGVEEDGTWVQIDDDVASVISEINRLWPSLVVQYFQTDAPALVSPKTAPFQIVERVGDREFFVMDVWQLDHRVIERLAQLDRARRKVDQTLEDIVLQENQKQREKLQEPWKERQELGKDLITHMGKNPKTSYTFKDPDTGETHKVSDG